MNHAILAQSCFSKQAGTLRDILQNVQENPALLASLTTGAGALGGAGIGALAGGGKGALIGGGIGGGLGLGAGTLGGDKLRNLIGELLYGKMTDHLNSAITPDEFKNQMDDNIELERLGRVDEMDPSILPQAFGKTPETGSDIERNATGQETLQKKREAHGQLQDRKMQEDFAGYDGSGLPLGKGKEPSIDAAMASVVPK